MENNPEVNAAPMEEPVPATPAAEAAVTPAVAAEVSLEPPVAKLPSMPEPPAAAAQPAISDADALTASRLVKLLSEAEERGYMRARRELTAAKAPAAQHAPLWSNPRRIEAEAESTIEIGDEFLATIRPTIWD